jgi:hypothetical protein
VDDEVPHRLEQEVLDLMKGRKRWSDIRAGAAPETLEDAARSTAEMLREIELREARQGAGSLAGSPDAGPGTNPARSSLDP